MSIFIYEFAFFLVSVFAAVVCIATGTLFFITFKHERLMRNGWRVVGFFSLAVAFIILILERKNPSFGLFGVICEMIGMLAIYRGVMATPSLVQLSQDPESHETTGMSVEEMAKGAERSRMTATALASSLIILASVIFAVVNDFFWKILPLNIVATFQGITFFLVFGTIMLQIERIRNQRGIARAQLQNILPTVAYIFLLMREAAVFLFRLPESNILFIRQLTLEYSMAWQLGIFFTFAAFIFLSLWAWNFIKYRKFLRTYVIFLVLSVIVATIGALIFTTLVFKIIERNNLDLMTRGAETQEVLLNDRQSLALFVAQLIANDEEFLGYMKNGDRASMSKLMDKYLNNAGVDGIRIFNKFGEVIVSPADSRDVGRIFKDDQVLAYVITKKVQLSTFDTESGVLTPVIVARAFNPLVQNGELLGAVEVDYRFDNAFTDYAKEATGLDVTIYTGSRLSATTIKTLDGVSRWVGSEETDKGVLDNVLGRGMPYATQTDRLGRQYYNAYKPIRNLNGQIIGMVSVGTLANQLFEDTRQQLLTIFLLVTFLALVSALIAYRLVVSSRLEQGAKPAPKK